MFKASEIHKRPGDGPGRDQSIDERHNHWIKTLQTVFIDQNMLCFEIASTPYRPGRVRSVNLPEDEQLIAALMDISDE